MTRGVKVRLIAFAVLAAVGIVYVAGAYLGLIDKLLGRGMMMHVDLPSSGGLFIGSEVTYRGVKIGNVDAMDVTDDGLRADVAINEGVQIPKNSKVYVHNLSAVGEQYLDFEPPSDKGPYLEDGDVLRASSDALPVDDGALLIELDEFVRSVDKKNLNTVIEELGTTFEGTAYPMRRMLDGGETFLDAAIENENATFRLLENGRVTLETQAAHASDIRAFSADLADLTGTLRAKDPEVRVVLEGGGATAREAEALLRGLEPTLPVFIGDLATLSQIFTTRLSAIEQLLVTFPRMVSSGFTGTPGDGYGHINLQTDNSVGPCRRGYKPSSQWRPPSDLSDGSVYPAQCLEGLPKNVRGTKHAPSFGGGGTRVAPYDPVTGEVAGAADVPSVTLGQHGGRETVFGDDSWRWLLTGPLGATR